LLPIPPPPPRSSLFPYTTLFRSAPVHALEARRQHLGRSGGQDRLADAAEAEHRHQPTTLLQHPAVQGSELVGAADEAEHVRGVRSEEHTSELQSLTNTVCRLLLE